MGIRRACSYQATFHTPEEPSGYSAILVTIQQDGTNMINKTEADLVIGADYVTLKLTQAETAVLSEGTALMQIRCFESAYNAPGSKVFGIDVYPALNDTILS